MSDRYRPSRAHRSGTHRSGANFDPAPRRQWRSWDDDDDGWGSGEDDGWDQPTIRRRPSPNGSARNGRSRGGSARNGAGDYRGGRGAWRDDDNDDYTPPSRRSLHDDDDGWDRSKSRPSVGGYGQNGAARGRPYAAGSGARAGNRAGSMRGSAARSAPRGGGWMDTVERWGETSRQWVVSTAQRLFTSEQRAAAPGSRSGGRPGQGGKQPEKKANRVVMLVVIAFVLACPLLGVIQLAAVYFQARSGLDHFKNAQTELAALATHPFDPTAVAQLRGEFAGAYGDFGAANAGIQRIPGLLGVTPGVGSKLAGAQHLLPIATEATQAGMLACDALGVIAPKMKNPLDASGPGITADDLKKVSATFAQIKPIFDTIVTQVGALQPSDLDLDPRLGPMVNTMREKLPEIKQIVTDLQATLAIAGGLLGVGQPSNYLLEVMDSTELRPGGGFIGNYGFITLNGGHLAGINMQDVDLLDVNAKYGSQVIPIPPNYSWFSTFSRWGFRDSNLDADFPTSAKNGEQLYKQETGSGATPVVGVIAITPWLIQNMLKVTGKITMPEYNNDQISADNLVAKIHYYQLTDGVPPGSDKTYDPVSLSSLRKRFSGLLFKHFMETVKAQSAQDMGPLMKVLTDALHTKDIQVYLDPAPAQDLLAQTHLGSTIDAPATGDSLIVVDANIIANKSNYVVANALSDQVTVDEKGNAVHHTTLTYTWPKDPATLAETYPSTRSTPSRLVQYQRVYVPLNAKLDKRSGWYQTDTGKAFNRQVWGGKMAVDYGTTTTLTLDWTDPGAVTHDATGWHYRYLLQKQAGARYTFDLKLTLPACGRVAAVPSGFKAADAHTLTLAPAPFATDTNVSLDYTGC